jgi:hypothetical protein
MNGYQFIASMVQSIVSLAWPIAIFACVWLFRQRLQTLLPLLRVKHKDWEASFRLDQAEKEAAELPPTPATPEAEPTPEEKDKFQKLVEISPRAAILEQRAEIEDALEMLAKTADEELGGTRSLLQLTRKLRSLDIIDPTTSAILDDLRVIGNNAAHRLDTEFTSDEAQRYRRLANNVINRLTLTALKRTREEENRA